MTCFSCVGLSGGIEVVGMEEDGNGAEERLNRMRVCRFRGISR